MQRHFLFGSVLFIYIYAGGYLVERERWERGREWMWKRLRMWALIKAMFELVFCCLIHDAFDLTVYTSVNAQCTWVWASPTVKFIWINLPFNMLLHTQKRIFLKCWKIKHDKLLQIQWKLLTCYVRRTYSVQPISYIQVREFDNLHRFKTAIIIATLLFSENKTDSICFSRQCKVAV